MDDMYRDLTERIARDFSGGLSFNDDLDEDKAVEIAYNINAMLSHKGRDLGGVRLISPLFPYVGSVNDDGIADGMARAWARCMVESGVLASTVILEIYDGMISSGNKEDIKIIQIIVSGIDWDLVLNPGKDSNWKDLGLDASVAKRLSVVRELFQKHSMIV